MFTSPVPLHTRMQAEMLAGTLHPAVAAEMIATLRQHRRAENGDRSHPGEYNADPGQPTIPLPFAPKDTHHPDRQPGSRAHANLEAASNRLYESEVAHDLIARMRENDPATGTWARSQPDYRPPSQADNSPPSLREQVSAAASLEYPGDSSGEAGG